MILWHHSGAPWFGVSCTAHHTSAQSHHGHGVKAGATVNAASRDDAQDAAQICCCGLIDGLRSQLVTLKS